MIYICIYLTLYVPAQNLFDISIKFDSPCSTAAAELKLASIGIERVRH